MDEVLSVTDSWSRIERWLAEYAPVSYGQLNPPAKNSMIAEAERVLGVRFPPSLVALLGLRNGTTEWRDGSYVLGVRFLPGDYRLLPIDEIVRSSRMLTEIILRSEEKNPDINQVGWWWHPSWVPFAGAVWGGHLFTDQRDSEEGRVGEFVKDDEARLARWPSLSAMLTEIADALDAGSDIGYYRPQVVNSGLDWEIVASGRPRS